MLRQTVDHLVVAGQQIGRPKRTVPQHGIGTQYLQTLLFLLLSEEGSLEDDFVELVFPQEGQDALVPSFIRPQLEARGIEMEGLYATQVLSQNCPEAVEAFGGIEEDDNLVQGRELAPIQQIPEELGLDGGVGEGELHGRDP